MVFAIAPFASAPAQAVTSTYNYTTSLQSFTVPESVYSMTITMYGGGGGIGGKDCSSSLGTPGYIGKITGTINVRPGDIITIAIGGGGVNGQSSVSSLGSGSQGGTNPIGTALYGNSSSYNGGGGGAAGGSGTSGSGGGGGAATVVHVTGHGYFIAAGAGGSGGDNCSGLQDAAVNAAVPSATTSRTRADSGNLYGATGGSTSVSVDGGGSGGGGGGFTGGGQTTPQKYNGSGETYGYGGSGGTNTVAATAADIAALTSSMVSPATQLTSGCHYTGATNWSNYGCGADGSVTLAYAPTATLTQKDQNTATVSSTEVGTVYLVNETVSVTNLASITSLPSSLMVATTISAANTSYDVALSGLSPGTYVAYAYGSSSTLLSTASRTTVAAGGMCTFTSASGLTFSNAYRLGYCFVTFFSGSGNWNVPLGVSNVSFLAVGGGGGGGQNGGSGGGGGALQDIPYYTVTSGGTVSVTVGSGGTGGSTAGGFSASGSSGSATVFGSYTANGGGGGNSTGGSGGVGGVGGTGGSSAGGAGSTGSTSVGANPGTAGSGATSLIRGTSSTFAGGGAGGDWQTGIGTPGTGGGWSGIELQQVASYTNASANTGGNGFPNTGGGGGGGATNYGFGGAGGSGLVVVRYIATSYKPSAPASPTIYPGDTATFTSTAPALASGITRTNRWQLSYDKGATWSNVDTGTMGISSIYTTPSETNTTLTYWFRAQITDTTSIYSFVTTSDTATIYFILRNSSDTDTAMIFNGSQNIKTTPVTYSNSSGGTVEVWVKPDASSCTASYNATVVYKPNAYWIFCNNNKWGGVIMDGTNTSPNGSFGNFAIHAGEWSHLALVYDGSNLFSYLNGQLVDTQTTSYSAGATATSWYVGCSTNTATDYFTGQIDELKIWSIGRTASQVVTDMDTYTATNSSNLYAYYDFNEGSGSLAFNRVTPRTNASKDLTPDNGSTTYTFALIESTTVSGNYKITQFLRTIITAAGGWKIPKQVNTAVALIVGGGGGGGTNAGSGGGGGGGLQGIAAMRATKSPLNVKVGQGGVGALLSSGNNFNGQVGRPTTISLADSTLNATANGGSAGLSHWLTTPCGGGATAQTQTIAGGSVSSTTGIKNPISSTGGTGGATPPATGNVGGTGGTGFTSNFFTGSHLYGGGGGGGSWGVGTYSVGGGDNGLPRGGKGGTPPASGDRGGVATGNGGGGAGNNTCNYFGGEGGSGTVLLKYLSQDTITTVGPVNDTYTAGAKYTFQVTASAANGNLIRSYQWQYSTDTGTTWSDLATGSGYLTSSYTTPILNIATSGPQFEYRCIVVDSDTDGASIYATSSAAYINIIQSPSIAGSSTISTTYGSGLTTSYTPLNGLPTRKFTMVAGSYGGYLDSTLNGVGYETITFTQGNSYSNAVAFSPDGNLIVGGQTTSSGQDNFSLIRMSTTGAIDSSFGTNGRVVTNMGAKSLITAMNIDSTTGTITAVGQGLGAGGNDGRVAIARYLKTGVLDTTFATIGYETLTVPNSSNTGNYVTDVLVQSDGKILIGLSHLNQAGDNDSATILRLTATGLIDTSFGNNGYAEFDWGLGYNYTTDLAIQGDGKILLAGQEQDTNTNGTRNFAASRLLANGAVDTSYGNAGTIIFSAPCSGSCLLEASAQIQTDNSIYFIGVTNSAPYSMYTAHVNANGTQDLNWGSNGFTTEVTSATCRQGAIAVNAAGQIAATCTYVNTNYYNQIYLYDTSGVKVPTFGNAGLFTSTLPVGTGLSPKSQISGYPAKQFFGVDSSSNFWIVGSQGSNYAVMKIGGNSLLSTSQSPFITLDTTTFEVGKIIVDSATSAGTYYQTLIVTDSASVSTTKLITISVAKAPGVTISASSPSGNTVYTGDTLTTFETVTTSGLVAGDTVTISYGYKAPSTDTLTAVKVMGDTYTLSPVQADTFTITPSVTSINHGSVSAGVLSNYLSTTYVTGTLKVGRGVRTGFAINSSSGYAYGYVGAPLKLSVINSKDTGTVSFTLVSGSNCVLDTNTLLLSDSGTTGTTCVVSATIARTTNWETVTTQTTFYFQSYVNYYPSPADGTGPTIALSGQVAITIVAGAPTITGALVYSYDSTAAVVFTITGTGFGSQASAVQVKIGRKLGTITAISDTSITVNFLVPTYGDNVNWGRLSVATPVAVASIPTEYISGQPWRYSTQVNI